MPTAALSFFVLATSFALSAHAQVFQCTDATGKKIFSQTPCAAQGGNEKKLMAAPAPTPAAPADGTPVTGVLYGNGGGTPPPKDWAAENAAANARANAGNNNSGSSGASWPPLGGLRGKTGTQTTPVSDKQIVADCEANRGARCNSSGEIAQRRMEQRTLTPEERQQQQGAIAARKQRQLEESFNRR